VAADRKKTSPSLSGIGRMISPKKIAQSARGILAQATGFLPGTSARFGVPRHFETNTVNWFLKKNPSGNTNGTTLTYGQNRYFDLEGEKTCHRKQPVFVDAILQEKISAALNARLLPRFVASLNSGRCLGSCFGCVVTEDDTLLQDVSLNSADWCKEVTHRSEHNAFKIFPKPVNLKVDGEVIVLNTPFSSNFHHFLLDTLPRLGLCQEAGIDWTSARKIITDYRQNPFQIEAFAKLGIKLQNILPVSPGLHLEAKVLHAPSISEPICREQYVEYSKAGMEFVRSKIRPAISPRKKRRLLLSRRLAKCRRWLEEEEALPELEAMGFVRVECESLSLEEQARLFGEAEAVIMPHGGGMANCVFCDPGTKVFELFHPLYHPIFMLSLSNVLGLDYHAIAGEVRDEDRLVGDFAANVDVRIPAKKMISLLKRFL
jgi:capsular polysaccharide biosynthesis protein